MQPPCILYSQDAAFVRYVTGLLHGQAEIRTVGTADEALLECSQADPMLLLLDLTSDDVLDLLHAVRQEHPDSLIIAFGTARSDPALEAEAAGVYAVEPPTAGRLHLRGVMKRAFAHLALIEENRALREPPPAASFETGTAGAALARGLEIEQHPLGPITSALREAGNVDDMLQRVTESAANAIGASSAGIFAVDSATASFRLRGSMRCLAETNDMSVGIDDPFARWLERQAHMVARATLPHVRATKDRTMIKRRLDQLGAEAIVPLHGRHRLIGWLFVGHLASGLPYEAADLGRMVSVADDVAVVLENGLLSEAAAVQKTLGDTVLQSIPAGIVAIDAEQRVQWFNTSAETMLGIPLDAVMGQSPAKLGSRLADLLVRGAGGEATEDPVKWVDPVTGIPLSVVTRPLMDRSTCLGVVAILSDLSRERLLREKQERIDRAAFWAELAAAISHEVRNPLVAISTFAQLLPERYGDPEFRQQFSDLAVREIRRLNSMIDQINEFANPPELCFAEWNIGDLLTRAANQAKALLSSGIPVRVTASSSLPPVRGDASALAECFTHVIMNAIEAVKEASDPSVLVVASQEGPETGAPTIVVKIQDNGRGISPDIVDKVFSPFCTMKARGIGLGLPIVKRTITDHSGHIDITTGGKGTTVGISLPAVGTKKAVPDEATYPGSG